MSGNRTYSSAQIDRLFCNLEHVNINICLQALREIENLDGEVLSKHYITIIKRLLSAFKRFPTNSSFSTHIGACIDKYLIVGSDIKSDKLLKSFLNILGLKLMNVTAYSIDSYLRIIEGTILKAQDLLSETRFLHLFLLFVQRQYLYLSEDNRTKIKRLISIMTSLIPHYISVFKDSLPVALKLTHLGSKSLQKVIFHLLRTVYEIISASTDKPFLDCNGETIRILLNVLSDDCALIYHQRQDQDMLIPVLTTLPVDWFYNTIDHENEDEGYEASLHEAVIILNYLHIISQSNAKTIEWYLVPQFSLTASIAALLLYSKEEIAEGCVLSLLDSIISQIAKSKYAENHSVKAYLGLKFECLLKNLEFIQTLISRNKVKLAQIMSNPSEQLYSDYRNRSPAQWADYLGAIEIKKYLTDISENFKNYQLYSIKRRRLDGLKTDNAGAILTSQEINEDRSSERQQLLHLLYFTAEILPILLIKYQHSPSEIHRHTILVLIYKIVNNIPRQILELIIFLNVNDRSILHTLCKIIKDAVRSRDNETSVAAYTLNRSLLTTLPSAYLPLARGYNLHIKENKWNIKCIQYNKPSSLKIYSVDWNHGNCHHLTEISGGILGASELFDKQLVVTELKKYFLALKNILRREDLVITSHKLQISGLINALIDCFTASSCGKWSQSINFDSLENHYDYLLERRNTFMRLFHKSQELNTLFQLLVDAMEEVGSFSIYLPELLFKMNGIKSSCYDIAVKMRNSDNDEAKFLLKGRNLEMGANNKVVKIMEHWFDIIPKSEEYDLENTEDHLLKARNFVRLRGFFTNEANYLKRNPDYLPLEYFQTLNQFLTEHSSVIFDNWFTDDRRKIAGFRPFYENKYHFMILRPESTLQDFDENRKNCLRMSVFDWLGTGCGQKEYFLNPALMHLIRICSVRAGHSENDLESDSFVGRSEIHGQNHMKELVGESKSDVCDGAILEGKKIGSRLIIDLGLDLVPSAYCLSCIYDTEGKRPITNWCLQGSNDGSKWSTLSVHKNDKRIRGENVIIPLQLNDTLPNSLKSYRMFRILDLSSIDKQSRMQVCGLDFFGIVVGIHWRLLDNATLAGTNEIPETKLHLTYLRSQMKALKSGAKFLPVKYVKNKLTAYHYRDEDVEPMEAVFSALFDYSNCINMSTKRRLPRLRFKLASIDKEKNIIDSIEIDNFNIPIFKYATRLAENLAQKCFDFQTSLSLECFLSDDSEEFSTTTDESDRILGLIYLLYQMSSSYNLRNSTIGRNPISEGEESASLKYYSQRLCILIERQLNDSTALGLGIIPRWCDGLNNQISILIPFDLRIKLFRACAFGFSRTMEWIGEMRNRKLEQVDKRRHLHLPIQPKSIQSSAKSSNILKLLGAYHEFFTDAHPKFTIWHGSIGNIAKMLRRNTFDSDDGKEFWSSAESLMNENAESKLDFEFSYNDEPGYGEGVDRDFYSELSGEFLRKSGFMWLNSSNTEDSPFVHTTFGLFPTPYPRHLVPLEVLKRFHILGISIAKAIQDVYLMDLPLSKPLLKIMLGYNGAIENLHQSGYQSLENLEKCREATFSCSNFIRHWNLSGTGSRHWLTGLLDAEDFLILYPHFQNILPGFLELYRRQRQFLETTKCCEVKPLHEFLDKNSKEIFGAVLGDLCLPMTMECLSHAKPTTVKLSDIYPWESTDPKTSDREHEEIEYVTNDNYIDYIRRLLEFCLDKGIRVQMEAFVCGFERVFPLKWLSMFTCTELANLISGQFTDKPWSMEELKSNINFSGFKENSKTVQYFLEVLIGFDMENRRKFLRFVTGNSTLPMGGWRNLSPQLQVVKLTTGSGNEYPSTQVCFHNLYLREYTSLRDLRDNLVFAINQTAFLNE